MAEKKVSARNRKNSNPLRDNSYDDFIAEYASKLRRRATKVVPEPVKRQSGAAPEESRCGEIDPHMTVNPSAEHQISTRRGGRMFSDDSGFRAESYNQRFELTAEMPELAAADNSEVIEESSIPGQQTMADLMQEQGISDAVIPVEAQIDGEAEDPFAAAYKDFRSRSPIGFGKSEKLRAIARTATDDAGSEADNQLSFPAFDPLFSFPEEEEKEEKRVRKKARKKVRKASAEKTEENQSFDIEEAEIVTNQPRQEENTETQPEEKEGARNKFVDFLTDKEFQQEIEPAFEIGAKNEISSTLRQLTKHGRASLIKTAALFFLGLVLFIIIAVSGSENVAFNAVTSLVFLIISGVLCIKELTDGVKDILRKRLTQGVAAIIFIIPALIQILTALITKSSAVQLLTPAVIISLTAITAPQLLLTNNAKLTAGMLLSGDISLFRKASDGGIEGVVKEKFAGDGALRYSTRAGFTTGIMKKLTNAVPKPIWANAVYLVISVLALISAVAASFISDDSLVGASALCAIMITALPTAYTLVAALFLYNTNNDIAPGRSSLISYKCASELTETKAVAFSATDIIEHSACSIHGVKAFGGTDPHLASLCCASVINATGSPLSGIMKQITDQTQIDVPEAESFEVIAEGGVRAIVEGNSVLFGTREFLIDNGIYIPKENYEDMFLTGDRKLLYLALNGKFALILIVSYHIKRSVAAFFKNLASRGIGIVIYSADPNLTPAYIAKKCKLPENSVFGTGSAETAYFMDKETRTQSALPADVFTDGSVNAVANLFRKAFKINKAIYILPFVSYIMSALCVFLIICPLFLGSASIIGNLYVILLRVVTFAASVVSLLLLSKQK